MTDVFDRDTHNEQEMDKTLGNKCKRTLTSQEMVSSISPIFCATQSAILGQRMPNLALKLAPRLKQTPCIEV